VCYLTTMRQLSGCLASNGIYYDDVNPEDYIRKQSLPPSPYQNNQS
jgi:hypothetical protein